MAYKKDEIEIKGLELEDFDIGPVFDGDGYHLDVKIDNFKELDNGIYEMSIERLGRSDKLS